MTSVSCSTSTTFTSTDEVRELVAAFETGTLSKEGFTHRAHLTVALWYLVWYGPDAATDRVREAILKFNALYANESRAGGGYHETITRFYMWAVRRQLRAAPLEGSLADLANDVAAALADRALLLRYYSRERLMSDDARLRWVEPDLEPLDHLA